MQLQKIKFYKYTAFKVLEDNDQFIKGDILLCKPCNNPTLPCVIKQNGSYLMSNKKTNETCFQINSAILDLS